MAGSSWRYAPGDGVSVEMSTDVGALVRELAERSNPIVVRELEAEMGDLFSSGRAGWVVGERTRNQKPRPHSRDLLTQRFDLRDDSIDAILDSPAPYTLLIRTKRDGTSPWKELVDKPSELAADRLADRLAGLLVAEVA